MKTPTQVAVQDRKDLEALRADPRYMLALRLLASSEATTLQLEELIALLEGDVEGRDQ